MDNINIARFLDKPLRHFIARVTVYTMLGIFLLSWDPFGMNTKANQVSQDVVYRLIANFYDQGPGKKVRDKIVLVLLDDTAIQSLHGNLISISSNEWPLLYSDHAKILAKVASYRPKGIFVDIYFKKERSTDSSLDRMLNKLKNAGEKYDTKWFFAAGSEDEQLSEIQRKLDTIGTLSIHAWKDYGEAYPLFSGTRKSAAQDLYELACTTDNPWFSCKNNIHPMKYDPLSIVWGNDPAELILPNLRKLEGEDPYAGECYLGKNNFIDDFLKGVSNGAWSSKKYEKSRIICPYHPYLYAHDIIYVQKQKRELERLKSKGINKEDQKRLNNLYEAEKKISSILKDSIVLYGVYLKGLNDVAYSPVHGQLPGVAKHAMALDNLVHYGEKYVRVKNENMTNYVTWFFIVLFISFFLWLNDRRLVNGKPVFRHAGVIYIVGVVSVAFIGIIQFVILNYEPLNAISYFGLIILLRYLVGFNVAKKIMNWSHMSAMRISEKLMHNVRRK